jgi:hypothetical protein
MSRDRTWLSLVCHASVMAVLVAATSASTALAGKSAKVSLFAEYALANPDSGSILKSDVTITVQSLGPSYLYDFPELFAFDPGKVAAPIAGGVNFGTYCEKDYEGRYWWYTFGCGENDLAVFQVAIQNGTDHILRMKDARIYLEVADHDPISPVTRLGDPTLVPGPTPAPAVLPKSAVDADESLIHWVTYFEQEAEKVRSKKTFLDNRHVTPIGLASQVIGQNRAAYKLIADPTAEILPGRTLKGILLFPVLADFPSAALSFYEVHTKTDPGGNPIEKQTFVFPIKLNRVQMQWDGDKEKRWKVASAGEG